MIKYIGSKRVLAPEITRLILAVPDVRTVVDLFSGACRVGHALKAAGVRVIANDCMAYAHTIASCYIEADRERVLRSAERLVAEFNALPGAPGWFTQTYCEESRFFMPRNGARVDAIREAIARRGLDPLLESVMLTSLMEAADRVDSTAGVQMAYLKRWAPRASNDLTLRMPNVLPRAPFGKGAAHRMDALDAAGTLEGDLVYIDPPYNQHSYLGNYHIWESLVRWDKPEVYGVARKRVDCRTRKSLFNSRRTAADAMRTLIARVRRPNLVVSFSNEGFISRAEMESILASRGDVRTFETAHRRYVGAQIGVYNPRGEKVGRATHLHNTERIYVVTPAGRTLCAEAPAPLEPGAAALQPV